MTGMSLSISITINIKIKNTRQKHKLQQESQNLSIAYLFIITHNMFLQKPKQILYNTSNLTTSFQTMFQKHEAPFTNALRLCKKTSSSVNHNLPPNHAQSKISFRQNMTLERIFVQYQKCQKQVEYVLKLSSVDMRKYNDKNSPFQNWILQKGSAYTHASNRYQKYNHIAGSEIKLSDCVNELQHCDTQYQNFQPNMIQNRQEKKQNIKLMTSINQITKTQYKYSFSDDPFQQHNKHSQNLCLDIINKFSAINPIINPLIENDKWNEIFSDNKSEKIKQSNVCTADKNTCSNSKINGFDDQKQNFHNNNHITEEKIFDIKLNENRETENKVITGLKFSKNRRLKVKLQKKHSQIIKPDLVR